MTNMLQRTAKKEDVSVQYLKKGIKKGHIVLVKNRKHRITPIAIGHGLSTKVNANIGTSPDVANIRYELKKLEVAIKAQGRIVFFCQF